MPKPTGAVYLCENAIIDNSYSNTIDFKNPSEQRTYWGSLVKYTVTDFMYIRRTRSYIKVAKSLTELDSINYLYFRAEEDARLYYCFVTGKEYISDTASYIYFETDVLQTYMFDYEIKESYVLQEHCDRWTADHKPIFSRTNEGLDYGEEYTVENAYNILPRLGLERNNAWYLVTLKEGFDKVSEGEEPFITAKGTTQNTTDFNRIPSPYLYLLVPGSSNTPYGIVYEGRDENKVKVSLHNMGFFGKIMANSKLGSYVAQIVRLPYLPFNFVTSEDLMILDTTQGDSKFSYVTLTGGGWVGTFIAITYYCEDGIGGDQKGSFKKLAEMDLLKGLEDSIPTAEQWAEVKSNPYSVERDKRFESKLLTYPYRYNLFSDWKGQPVIIKNEYIGSDKIQVNFIQSIGFNAPARYWIDNYRKDPEGRSNSILQPLQEDLPIVIDQYYEYMLQNRNQIQADRTNLQASNLTALTNTAISGLTGSLLSGSAGGLATGLFSTATELITGKATADTNYQNLVRSQNAIQKDIRNLPDTIVSSNDGSFNLYDDNRYISLYRMKICCEFEELLADTFATSGYTVKRVKLPNLRSRVRYNYIKTIGANVVGSFNQDDLAKIRAIFDNGVTFWHYNTVNFKPYDYSLENIETSLI